jgi:hypothetical protein
MPRRWVHETLDLIAYGRPYGHVHRKKDEESQRAPGRRHREVGHDWYQAFGKLWSFSDPFPNWLKESIQRLRDAEGADSAEKRMVSDTHDYLDRIWDDLPEIDRIGRKAELAWVLLNPQVLKDWAGVDVLGGKIQRVVEGQEIWENSPDIMSKYEDLCRDAEFEIRVNKALRHALERYGQESVRPTSHNAV